MADEVSTGTDSVETVGDTGSEGEDLSVDEATDSASADAPEQNPEEPPEEPTDAEPPEESGEPPEEAPETQAPDQEQGDPPEETDGAGTFVSSSPESSQEGEADQPNARDVGSGSEPVDGGNPPTEGTDPGREPLDQDSNEQLDEGPISNLDRPPRSGDTEYLVVDPSDTGTTITDIDRVEDGVLWEEKTAQNSLDNDRWVDKHINQKFDRYVKSRAHLEGYEDAAIGFDFKRGDVDPQFRSDVETAIATLRDNNKGIDIRLRWKD